MKISHLVLAVIASLPLVAQSAQFTSTADGKALDVPAALFDTPAAKEFLASGKNSYVGNAAGIKAGKKVYQLYSCSQCHGPTGGGQVGPSLIDANWNYPKNSTDHGIFETLWGGTAGGMGAKGKGLMQPDDPTQGLTPDEILKVTAFLRAGGKVADATPAAEPTKAADTAPAATPTAEAPKADAATPATPSAKTKTKKMVKKHKKA